MWAVINARGEAIPVSHTERGAKQYATRNNYHMVGYISPTSWAVVNQSTRLNGKWYTVNN